MEHIRLEGNKGADTLFLQKQPDDLVRIIIEHACTRITDAVVPVELITGLLAAVITEAGGITPAVEQTRWTAEYKAYLISRITTD